MKRLVIHGLLPLVLVSAAWAQEPGPEQDDAAIAATASPPAPPDLPVVPGTPEHVKELTTWLRNARAWQKWDQEWRGKAAWTWSGGVADRRPEPVAPSWMLPACADFSTGRITATQLLLDACALKAELSRNYEDLIAENIDRERQWYRKKDEDSDKSSFLSKVHIDTPYVVAQNNGYRVFSYFGVHITPFDIKKRVYIWLPPGFSLISLPASDGRKLTPAYGAGISVRWFDFRFPGAGEQSTMYFNVAEFFVRESAVPGVNTRLTMIGLSFTTKKAK